MSDQTGIEWTDATWNPVTGCTKVSPGCKNCYAERLAFRLRAMRNPRYENGFALTLQPDQLTLPLRWRKPRRIFVNSMSDLFHEAVPDAFIHQVFEVMRQADWHIFQVLTKRSRRLAGGPLSRAAACSTVEPGTRCHVPVLACSSPSSCDPPSQRWPARSRERPVDSRETHVC